MDTMHNAYLAGVNASLEGVTDESYITREELAVAYKVNSYLVNLGDDAGLVVDGWSFRVRLPMSLLVVKSTMSDGAYVCFVSGRTFLECFKIFFRRLDEDSVEWRVDKYR